MSPWEEYDKRLALKRAKPIKHGILSAYTNRACRCDACRRAAREDKRERRKLKSTRGDGKGEG